MPENKKIAVVYDWIDKWGGVERLLLQLHEIFPQAEFFTSYYDPNKALWAKNFKIHTSFIQRLPSFIKKSRILSFFLYPFAFEAFNFNGYDLVISLSSSFAKAVITKPKTLHICYLLSPTRYIWFDQDLYLNKFVQLLLAPYLKYLKGWDFVAAQRPDKIITLSYAVAEKCLRYYKRQAEVIYPPFETERWSKISRVKIQTPDRFFLVVSRLEPYKKVGLVIETFNNRKDNLIIVGSGTQESKLKKLAKTNIHFLKNLTDEELSYLYSQAQALIMIQAEDFGYTAVEGQFFGCPVISFGKSGVSEIIIDGKTGLFFEDQTEKSLLDGLARFRTISYNLKNSTRQIGRRNAEKFDSKKFKNRLNLIVNNIKV